MLISSHHRVPLSTVMALCNQSEAVAASARYDLSKVRRRGFGSIRCKLKQIRADYEASRRSVANTKIDSERATCHWTVTGRKRKAPLMPAACAQKVPKLAPALTKVPNAGLHGTPLVPRRDLP